MQAYLNQLIETLKISQTVAKENQQAAQDTDKKHYDTKAAVPQFKQGDKVLLHNPVVPVGKTKKNASKI